jgi:hypothetical protein
MILQLPDYVDFKSVIIQEEFTLNCEAIWSVFPKMDIDLELEEDKTILFIYNVVLPLVQNEMTVGVFLNNLIEVYFYNNLEKNCIDIFKYHVF